jgi:hypothetical protein
MRSKLFLLITLVILGHTAMAQFSLGIKGGVNITKIDGRAFSEEFRYGYHLGGFAEIGLGRKFSIQPEVLFNQYNTRTDSTFRNVYQNTTNLSNYQDVKLNYLSIPILLNYKLGIISLQAGPQFGVLISQDKTLLENGREAFSKGEFSLAGGAQINLSKLKLTGRYFVGLNDVGDISSQEKWKNQGFQLSLGLAIL